MSDEETVYVLPHRYGDNTPRVHNDPDCVALKQTDREPDALPRSDVSDTRDQCGHCAGWTRDRKSLRLAGECQENRQAVYDALREADQPLTRREIEFDAMLSKGAVLRTLRDLQELGQIERVGDNPEDGRKPRYRLRAMSAESPTRQRAVVDVRVVALLTLLVGLLYAVLSAVASGVMLG